MGQQSRVGLASHCPASLGIFLVNLTGCLLCSLAGWLPQWLTRPYASLTLFNAVYILTAPLTIIQMKTEMFQLSQKQLSLLFNTLSQAFHSRNISSKTGHDEVTHEKYKNNDGFLYTYNASVKV
jgi:fluoride ion exporter CrcB/FEX